MNTLLTSRAKPISKLIKPTSKTLYIALFSTSTSPSPLPVPYSSRSSSSLSPSSSWSNRLQDEDSRSVRVSVWWDIENCGVPNDVNVFRISQSITSAVRVNGIKGPVQITAFGDILCLDRSLQEALSSTGVNLVHIPKGEKNSVDRSLLVDLMYWVSQNPPPAHIFLISGDKDFSGILHKLRMSNYNILLAAREAKNTPGPGVLYSAASIMWYWNELAKGENLYGNHFNQPPDGPLNSWYGLYRGALQDPFAVFEQQKHSEVENSSNAEQSSEVENSSNAEQSSEVENSSNAEQSSVAKLRPIPMDVLRELRRVVNKHPEGLFLSELRDHLIKSKVPLDKKLYGHKKLSRFLMALPSIVKLEHRPDGQFFAQPASLTAVPESAQSDDDSAQTMSVNGRANCEIPTITRVVDVHEKRSEESNDVSVPAMTVNGGNRTVQSTAKAKYEIPTITRMVDVNEKRSQEISEKENTVEVKPTEGTFEKSTLVGSVIENDMAYNKNVNGNEASNEMVAEKSSPTEEGQVKSSNENEVHDPARSSSNIGLDIVVNADTVKESKPKPGFIARILNWCKFWRKEAASDTPIQLSDVKPSPIKEEAKKFDDAPQLKVLDDDAPQAKILDDDAPQAKVLDNDASQAKIMDDDAPHTRKHELFTKDSFWSALRSFLRTHRGADIVLKSSSREQIAERLRKEGPLFLQPLQAIDMRHLVDLLLTEKKWIKEFPTGSPRFRLFSLHEERSTPTQPPHKSNGLSSMFVNSEGHNNPPMRTSSVIHKKPSERTRTEILADCQKLLDEVLSQHPDGYNLSLVKQQFLEKYGYSLDHQKLGYPNLVSLLQQMIPGIKVEYARVFPDNTQYSPEVQSLGLKEKSTSSDNEMSDSEPENEDDDDVVAESEWDELGPVEKSKFDKQGLKRSLNGVSGEYKPSVIEDDDFSDTEEDAVKADERIKSKMNETDKSSLLQILDLWHGGVKEETNTKVHGLDVDSEDSLESSEDETNLGHKDRASKSYSYVVEVSEEDKKGNLIDDIVGNLKPSEAKLNG